MKIAGIKIGVLFLAAAAFFGCSKPEDKVVGKWVNEKTGNTIEFGADKKGAIVQRTDKNIPPNIPFNWSISPEGQIKVEVSVPGAVVRPAIGKLAGDDTLVLEQDTFKKAK